MSGQGIDVIWHPRSSGPTVSIGGVSYRNLHISASGYGWVGLGVDNFTFANYANFLGAHGYTVRWTITVPTGSRGWVGYAFCLVDRDATLAVLQSKIEVLNTTPSVVGILLHAFSQTDRFTDRSWGGLMFIPGGYAIRGGTLNNTSSTRLFEVSAGVWYVTT